MADSGRRHARSFEPPPWERDQFEALRRQKEIEQTAAEVAAEAAAAEQVRAAMEAAIQPDVAPEGGDARESEAAAVEVGPDASIEAMMAVLAAEEPKHEQDFLKIGTVFGGVVAAIGLVMIIWGVAVLFGGRSNAAVAAIWATGLSAVGLVFVVAGLRVVVVNLKKRGVI